MRVPAVGARIPRLAMTVAVLTVIVATTMMTGAVTAWGAPLPQSTDLTQVFLSGGIAGDMYVETPANGGDDATGDGSLSAPFATVAKANEMITGGHTIHIGPGEFACQNQVVKDDVSIEGAGASLTTLKATAPANVQARVLSYTNIGGGQSISNVTITGGQNLTSGGGMYLESSSATITGCVISGNGAAGYGGGIYVKGVTGSVYLVHTVISNNASADGGGMFVMQGSASLLNCTLASNRAWDQGGGGAIHARLGARLIVTSCDIISNSASQAGGGICLLQAEATITASTIASNSAGVIGGGVSGRDYNLTFLALGKATLVNSIVWGNRLGSSAQSQLDGGEFSATYSDIEGGFDGTGNVSGDPLFRDPAAGDFRLMAGSAAIDLGDPTGSPATDIAGITRPQGDGVDMGAHEYVFSRRTARADSSATNEDAAVVLNVLANDDPAESPLHPRTAVQFSDASVGTLEASPSGDVTYTPPADFNGTATFTYVPAYGTAQLAPVTVTITVSPVDDAPTAVDDTTWIAEDATAVLNVLDNDTDIDTVHSALTAVSFSTPTVGTLNASPSGDIVYTPPTDYNGTATFTYVTSDGEKQSAPATVTILVTAVQDAPGAVSDTYVTAEDTVLTVPSASGVLSNDTDADRDGLTASIVDGSKLHGTLSFSAGGGFTYTPARDYVGPSTATYRVFDGITYSAPATVTFNVTPVNDASVGVDDTAGCLRNASAVFNVLANDTDIDTPHSALQAGGFTAPTFGTIQTSPTGAVTFDPPVDFVGESTFTYRVTDGESISAPITVRITVNRAVVSRVGGLDRFDAAANSARRGWDPTGAGEWTGVKHVIIANGEVGKEADPLCAAGLAGLYDAPILLVQSRRVPASTRQALIEIATKNPGVTVHIVGGTGSVCDKRGDDLKGIAGVNPALDRIGGADRYAVSANIASRMIAAKGAAAIPAVLLVAGDGAAAFYDGLAAGPIAYARTMPLLAVREKSIPPVVAALLEGELAGKARYAVSSSTYIGKVPAKGATRLTTSKDRYKAASQIAYAALDRSWLSPTEVGVTAKLPDALTGGAVLGKRGGVLLFTDSDSSMPSATKSFLTEHEGRTLNTWIIGGTGSVTRTQENTIKAVFE